MMIITGGALNIHKIFFLPPSPHTHTRMQLATTPHPLPHLGSVILEADDTRCDHLMVEIIALSSPFPNTSKDRVAAMSLGHIVDELHDQYSLADTCSSKQT